jgi:hypothetical protein
MNGDPHEDRYSLLWSSKNSKFIAIHDLTGTPLDLYRATGSFQVHTVT